MKKSILFLISLFPFFVMCQNSNKKEEIALVFPSDTIPMQYSPDYPSFRIPILDGIVNDSLYLKVFFDTGTDVNRFSISDSYKNLFVNDSAFVQIGKFKKQMRIIFWGNNQKSFFDMFGKNTILVGWRFFENKIIEFDFQNQRILVYEELPDITEYSKIEITLFKNSTTGNSALLIPAQVVLQGKIMQDTFKIDTGCNDCMVLSSKHIEEQGSDTTNASYYNSTVVAGGVRSSFSILADTIKIGDLYVANQNMRITFSDYNGRGLLGTPTMENFSVILDLINYDLYLKKINKE